MNGEKENTTGFAKKDSFMFPFIKARHMCVIPHPGH